MKKLLLLSLFFTSFLAFSQNNVLLKTWYLSSLYLDGTLKENPFPNVGYIDFKNENNSVYAEASYYYFAGKTKIILDPENQFHLEHIGWAMLANGPGENQQMNQYGELFFIKFLRVFSQSDTVGCCFTYDISNDGKKLTLTNNEGNIATFYDSVMAVSEAEKSNYKLYPNPVSDILTIENLTPHSDLELIDSSGKVVKQIKNIQTPKTQINIKNLVPGIYYLKINNQSSQKIIKK